MRNPQRQIEKNPSDREANLDSRARGVSLAAFWEELEGVVSSKPWPVRFQRLRPRPICCGKCCLVFDDFWQSEVSTLGQRQPPVSAHPVESSLLLKSRLAFEACGRTSELCQNVNSGCN